MEGRVSLKVGLWLLAFLVGFAITMEMEQLRAGFGASLSDPQQVSLNDSRPTGGSGVALQGEAAPQIPPSERGGLAETASSVPAEAMAVGANPDARIHPHEPAIRAAAGASSAQRVSSLGRAGEPASTAPPQTDAMSQPLLWDVLLSGDDDDYVPLEESEGDDFVVTMRAEQVREEEEPPVAKPHVEAQAEAPPEVRTEVKVEAMPAKELRKPKIVSLRTRGGTHASDGEDTGGDDGGSEMDAQASAEASSAVASNALTVTSTAHADPATPAGTDVPPGEPEKDAEGAPVSFFARNKRDKRDKGTVQKIGRMEGRARQRAQGAPMGSIGRVKMRKGKEYQEGLDRELSEGGGGEPIQCKGLAAGDVAVAVLHNQASNPKVAIRPGDRLAAVRRTWARYFPHSLTYKKKRMQHATRLDYLNILDVMKRKFRGKRWYVVVHDDTYVLARNLLCRLAKMNHGKKLLLGATHCLGPNFRCRTGGILSGMQGQAKRWYGWANGGAGVVVSGELMETSAVKECIKHYKKHWDYDRPAADVIMSCCMKDQGADIQHMEGFSNGGIGFRECHCQKYTRPKCTMKSTRPISDKNLTFHRIRPEVMYTTFEMERGLYPQLNATNWFDMSKGVKVDVSYRSDNENKFKMNVH